MNLKIHSRDIYNYLKTELVQGPDEDVAEIIQIYINNYIPEPLIFEELLKYIPSKFAALDGIIHNYYVSYYYEGKIFLISDTVKRVTYAKISKEYEKNVAGLFLSGLFRNHMNRHWIAQGYHVYHASGIYDCQKDQAFLVMGASGSGKTTFALEALKCGKYSVISEDKVIINPHTNELFGSPIVHVKGNDMERYKGYAKKFEIINGGISNKKYRFVLPQRYYRKSAVLQYTIILNRLCEGKNALFRTIDDFDTFFYLYKQSQEGIYLFNECKQADDAYNYIRNMPAFELYRGEEKYNFSVYQAHKRGML